MERKRRERMQFLSLPYFSMQLFTNSSFPQFLTDAGKMMDLLLNAQTNQEDMADDDPQVSYLISAWARICKIMGKRFEPYLPLVMGPVLKTASLKPEVHNHVLDPFFIYPSIKLHTSYITLSLLLIYFPLSILDFSFCMHCHDDHTLFPALIMGLQNSLRCNYFG